MTVAHKESAVTVRLGKNVVNVKANLKPNRNVSPNPNINP